MQGRFVLDRDGVIWRRKASYRHKRYSKTASHLTRLKRWRPLYHTIASKFKKLGFSKRYWSDPDPWDVPGYDNHGAGGARAPRRAKRSAVPDLRDLVGDPALRPH